MASRGEGQHGAAARSALDQQRLAQGGSSQHASRAVETVFVKDQAARERHRAKQLRRGADQQRKNRVSFLDFAEAERRFSRRRLAQPGDGESAQARLAIARFGQRIAGHRGGRKDDRRAAGLGELLDRRQRAGRRGGIVNEKQRVEGAKRLGAQAQVIVSRHGDGRGARGRRRQQRIERGAQKQRFVAGARGESRRRDDGRVDAAQHARHQIARIVASERVGFDAQRSPDIARVLEGVFEGDRRRFARNDLYFFLRDFLFADPERSHGLRRRLDGAGDFGAKRHRRAGKSGRRSDGGARNRQVNLIRISGIDHVYGAQLLLQPLVVEARRIGESRRVQVADDDNGAILHFAAGDDIGGLADRRGQRPSAEGAFDLVEQAGQIGGRRGWSGQFGIGPAAGQHDRRLAVLRDFRQNAPGRFARAIEQGNRFDSPLHAHRIVEHDRQRQPAELARTRGGRAQQRLRQRQRQQGQCRRAQQQDQQIDQPVAAGAALVGGAQEAQCRKTVAPFLLTVD
ncbi:MAG: hypothetical protein BWZ10_01179 [candidate division BRC1 bacterium ADurb.BinA364]|nr:MAG: hypothetical protein BWZ10_01179 [candidate division BRC1 bacterium ADurb.BinA364]